MTPTKINHINPCFWTAFWNFDYYTSFISDTPLKKHREQKVYSLEFKAPKVLLKKVEDVHFIEGLGTVYLQGKDLVQLENIKSPITMNDFDKSTINPDDTWFIDFENHFTELEKIAGYDRIRTVIKTDKIENREDRMYLACFIIIHQIRSFKFLGRLFKKYNDSDNIKLQSYLHFKSVISNPDLLDSVIRPIVESKWTLYITPEFKFPLSDNPIVSNKNLTWIPLSPKHLLEIDSSIRGSNLIDYKMELGDETFVTFQENLVMSSFDSIIFSDKKTLEKIRETSSWKVRKEQLGYVID